MPRALATKTIRSITSNLDSFKDITSPASSIIIDTEKNEIIDNKEELEEKHYIPTKAELDKHIEDNLHKKDEERKQYMLDDSKHSCGKCVKGQNMSGIPLVNMVRCAYNGVMVPFMGSPCEHYKFAKNRKNIYL